MSSTFYSLDRTLYNLMVYFTNTYLIWSKNNILDP